MKTLKDFTPEIQAKIPEYIKRYTEGVFDGGKFNSFKKERAEESINYIYQKCGYKKPVILIAENPYEAQLMFNFLTSEQAGLLPLLYLIFCNKNEIARDAEGIPGSQLRSQLRSQLGSQLRSQLCSQLGSQLYSQLGSQLDSQLYSQLGSQFGSQLDSQLYSQLGSQFGSQLRSILKKYNPDYLWATTVFGLSYFGWYKFIRDEFDIKCDIQYELEVFDKNIREANIYSAIFSEIVCVVSKFPKKVHRNEANDLHCTGGLAVEWSNACEDTRFDNYFINGRSMPKWIFDKASDGTLSKDDFIKEDNEDIKAGIYEIIESKGEGAMLEFLGAKEVDSQTFIHADGSMESMSLYKTVEVFEAEEDFNGKIGVPLAWLKMVCPSTGTKYLIPSDSSFENCLDAAKFHRPLAVPQALDYTWNQRN